MPITPRIAMVTNHTSMIGPKARPTSAVPRRWTRNSSARMTTAAGAGHPVGREAGGRDVQPLERAQDRDRGRDDAVAVDQRRAEEAAQDERPVSPPPAQARARHQSQDPALAMVVGAHDEQAV